jgi:photosystem II stability/assembly factor-like uncharacterized protein
MKEYCNPCYSKADFHYYLPNAYFKVFIFSTLFFIISTPSFSQWKKLNLGVKVNLHAVHFIDSKTGFIAGDKGVLLKTTDAGKTWFYSNVDTNTNLYSISFPSPKFGYVTGYKTLDGGKTWSALNPANGALIKVAKYFFLNDSTGFEWNFNTSKRIGKTTNGGGNWTFYNTPFLSDIEQVLFTDDSTGYAVGWYVSMICKSSNGGKDWKPIADSFALYDVVFPDKKTGYAVGWWGTIVKTTDGGNTWFYQRKLPQVSTSLKLFHIHCLDTAHCYCTGENGLLLKTIDGGKNWTADNTETNNNIDSIYCLDTGFCFAVGDSGLILQLGDSKSAVQGVSQNYSRLKVYPNPTSNQLFISLKDLHEQSGDLKIYNSVGDLKYSKIITKSIDLSSPDLEIDFRDFPQGIYFITYETDRGIFSSSIIVN